MKTILSVLLSFLVAQAPVIALGRDSYGFGNGSTSVVGTYAGVLVPTGNSGGSGFGTNALGLFTLSIPNTGIGTGTFIVFASGEDMTGTIQALPDPKNAGGLVGIVSATVATGKGTAVATSQANGSLFASTSQSTTSASPNGINLSGTANLTVTTPSATGSGTSESSLTFAVDGFQQSAGG